MPDSKKSQSKQPEFEQALRRGLGRAVLWLASGAVVSDRNLILHACTHNWAYDSQTENNRALYLFDIIYATGEPEYYARAVEHSLAEVCENENECENEELSVGQMFDLLGLLAKSGDLLARRSVYSFYENYVAKFEESDAFRAEVLVDIDGLDGYLSVLHHWLRYPRQEDDSWYEAYLLERVEERFGTENVCSFFEQAALGEPEIGIYLNEVREKQVAWKTRQALRQALRPVRPQPNYVELHQLILEPGKRLGPMVWARWGEKLTDADAMRFAQDLLAETDPGRLERYLFLFRRRPFPLDHSPLLVFAREAAQSVATAARAALAQIEHPSIRALALDLIDSSSRPWELIELLTRNFCMGDEKAIERVLKKHWDKDEWHWLGLKLHSLVEANLRPVFTDVLMLVYEQGYCTICREGVVALLAELGPLPPSLIEECRSDAYEATRELVRANMER